MSSNLMDTEPGGEQTQYEGIQTFSKPHASQEGTLGGTDTSTNEATTQQHEEKAERGEKTAENIRYGESISEHGFGGETTGNDGTANERGFGAQQMQDADNDIKQSRRQQGYGQGSGVGA